jgi:hypothetical protein
MKKTDRFLLAIIAGIVVLVIIALTLAFTRTAQDYVPETTPGAVAYNYVLAIKAYDDERAYSYLAPEIAGYPPSVDAFTDDSNRYAWNVSREAATISIGNERITDDRAVVTISETRFYAGGLFNSNQYTNSFNITLRRDGEGWKIINADSYWVPCWTDGRPCV